METNENENREIFKETFKNCHYVKRAWRYNGDGSIFAILIDPKGYDQAIADYTEAIHFNLNDALAYYGRGVAYYNKKDYDRAIADFTQAIHLKPNDAEAYSLRGISYYNKKDYNLAIADFEAALRLDPNNTDTKQDLEIALQARGL
jgi:tetratricopeptide (TPR) repeat protein